MKIVIIGGVAAGTSAAAKARRNDEAAQITIYDADQDVSYSGCGLPYYIGTDIGEREQLVPRNAQFFKQKYNVDVLTGHQVLAIDSQAKTLMVENLATGQQFSDSYDKLIIAIGAQAVRPPIAGSDKGNVFHLRNVVSADRIRQQVLAAKPETAVVVGSGFIGMEMAENLTARGIRVSVVEVAEHVMPALDADMAVYVADYLQQQGVELIVQDAVTRLEGIPLVNKVVLKSGRELAADLVILAAGVQPNVELARRAGVELGPTGAVQVNERMETNIEDIYACGDCAESYSLITGKPFYRPLGSTANKMGRIAGDQASGGNLTFRGGLGTGIFKVFDLAVGQTGLTEKEAKREGYEAVVCHIIKPDKPEYFHGQEMVIKAVADRVSG
ncbi:FAD-dependent oxidoreductase, partial [Anaerospora hongkongensis]|uniref:FAD-dependent oxidoreductase n=1 Tax=Anaerospora hongkongensis TaxID=244830 RepID=UPI00289A315B